MIRSSGEDEELTRTVPDASAPRITRNGAICEAIEALRRIHCEDPLFVRACEYVKEVQDEVNRNKNDYRAIQTRIVNTARAACHQVELDAEQAAELSQLETVSIKIAIERANLDERLDERYARAIEAVLASLRANREEPSLARHLERLEVIAAESRPTSSS